MITNRIDLERKLDAAITTDGISIKFDTTAGGRASVRKADANAYYCEQQWR